MHYDRRAKRTAVDGVDGGRAMGPVDGRMLGIHIVHVGAVVGMVGAGDGDELGVRQACGALVWAADDLGSWAALGLTQPAQVPLILMAQAGLLRPWGIASKPSWKGRTCDP